MMTGRAEQWHQLALAVMLDAGCWMGAGCWVLGAGVEASPDSSPAYSL